MVDEMIMKTSVYPNVSPNPVVRLNVNVDGATDYELVAAVSGKSIRVLEAQFSSAAAVKAWLVSDGATDTEMMGTDGLALSTDRMVIGPSPWGALQTQSGDALDLRANGTGSIDGYIVYQLV